MKLSAEQIQENWDKLISIIEDTFNGDRKQKLLDMYNYFQDRMMLSPASGHEHFHSCYPGGYVQHILNIVHYTKQFYKIWKDGGAYMDDYTEKELLFSAIHYNLGKIGDLEFNNYKPNPSDWHRKNQGKLYINNSDLSFMTSSDRSIWILNQFDIKLTQNEYIGIKLANGMYDDGNIQYLKTYMQEKKLKSNLSLIIHQVDITTTRIEYENWLNFKKEKEELSENYKQEKVDKMKKTFDELFAKES